jgi:hypothetical protein
MVAANSKQMAFALADHVAAVRAAAIARPAAADATKAAVLQPRHLRVANQGCAADCDCEGRYRAGHRSQAPNAGRTRIVRRKKAALAGQESVKICNGMWRLRSLIIQAEYGTFALTERLIHCRCSFRPLSSLIQKGEAMKKTLMALAAVATLAISAVAAPAPAQAQRGLGAAVAGGLIGGAIVGGAIAASPYGPYGYGPGYYAPPPGYYGGPAYVAGDPYGGCVWQRQRFWDGYGWRIRRVRVCG